MAQDTPQRRTGRVPITHADTDPSLTPSPFAARLAELRISRTFAERSTANDNARDVAGRDGQDRDSARTHDLDEPSMVARERPYPAPRPSFVLASEVDSETFDARWEAERKRAAQAALTPSSKGDTDMSDDRNLNRPAETVREGALKAAIWRNETENGPYHSITVSRTYKDRDGNLQDTNNLRTKDLLGLAELARQTHHRASDLDREMFKEQRRGEQAQAQTRNRTHGQYR